jgi:hypothetical protein
MVPRSSEAVDVDRVELVLLRAKNLIVGLGIFLKNGKLNLRPVANFVVF